MEENKIVKANLALSEMQLMKTDLNYFNHGFPIHSIVTCLGAVIFDDFNPSILRTYY